MGLPSVCRGCRCLSVCLSVTCWADLLLGLSFFSCDYLLDEASEEACSQMKSAAVVWFLLLQGCRSVSHCSRIGTVGSGSCSSTTGRNIYIISDILFIIHFLIKQKCVRVIVQSCLWIEVVPR